jgi:hypothetical protein
MLFSQLAGQAGLRALARLEFPARKFPLARQVRALFSLREQSLRPVLNYRGRDYQWESRNLTL